MNTLSVLLSGGKVDTLYADIGGTFCRVQINRQKEKVFLCRDYDCFEDILKQYSCLPKKAVVAVAGVVDNQRAKVKLTNNHWEINRQKLKKYFDEILIVNDFYAQALAIPYLKSKDLFLINKGQRGKNGPKVICGIGTGLGVGVYLNGQIISTESGHVDFLIKFKEDLMIFDYLKSRGIKPVAETILSGGGIELLYDFYSGAKREMSCQQIIELAGQGDEFALKSIKKVLAVYGCFVGNLALYYGAVGGIYLSGGIIGRKGMIDLLKKSDFMKNYLDKGCFKTYVSQIPIYIIQKPELGLFGLHHPL